MGLTSDTRSVTIHDSFVCSWRYECPECKITSLPLSVFYISDNLPSFPILLFITSLSLLVSSVHQDLRVIPPWTRFRLPQLPRPVCQWTRLPKCPPSSSLTFPGLHLHTGTTRPTSFLQSHRSYLHSSLSIVLWLYWGGPVNISEPKMRLTLPFDNLGPCYFPPS